MAAEPMPFLPKIEREAFERVKAKLDVSLYRAWQLAFDTFNSALSGLHELPPRDRRALYRTLEPLYEWLTEPRFPRQTADGVPAELVDQAASQGDQTALMIQREHALIEGLYHDPAHMESLLQINPIEAAWLLRDYAEISGTVLPVGLK